MVGVLKRTVEMSKVLDVVEQLLKKFRCVKVATAGSKIHRRMGLRSEEALVSAWSRRQAA